uniref:Rho GTPase activating protein 10 n=1 Tax=Accipiter nisus TaxID=211598 RepID=A0A8B9RPA7_9AVES
KFEFIGDAETDDERYIGSCIFCVQADNQVEQNRKHFYELSLEYVCKLQEIQERKKFECVEPVLSFFQGLFTFYHQGYELAKDFNHYKMALQINIQNTRNRFEGTRSEVEELMNKIRRNPQEHKRANHFTMEGYLYVQEKRPAPFGSSWVKHYCMYRKETKKFTMIPFEHRSGGKVGDEELFVLTYCTKRNIDTIDRRFCFDLEASDRPGVPVTMQAFSEEDRKLWMEALDGKEAVSAQLDKIGFTVIKKCISAVETRGINDQGLYRVVGVSSKVQRLLSLLMDAKTCNEVDLENSVDWEVKTITSAMKQYLRYLFLCPIESGSPESRVNAVHFLVHKLPEKNKEMLEILVKHLANVSKHAKKNLMTVANLGVVFGPTLMRPQEETVAAIMDLKFQNIVVEILIENHEKVSFDTSLRSELIVLCLHFAQSSENKETLLYFEFYR